MQVQPRALGGCRSKQYGGGWASASSLPLPGPPSCGVTQVPGPAGAEGQAACVGTPEDAGSQPLDAWYGTPFQRYWINTIYIIIICFKYLISCWKFLFLSITKKYIESLFISIYWYQARCGQTKIWINKTQIISSLIITLIVISYDPLWRHFVNADNRPKYSIYLKCNIVNYSF